MTKKRNKTVKLYIKGSVVAFVVSLILLFISVVIVVSINFYKFPSVRNVEAKQINNLQQIATCNKNI